MSDYKFLSEIVYMKQPHGFYHPHYPTQKYTMLKRQSMAYNMLLHPSLIILVVFDYLMALSVAMPTPSCLSWHWQ